MFATIKLFATLYLYSSFHYSPFYVAVYVAGFEVPVTFALPDLTEDRHSLVFLYVSV